MLLLHTGSVRVSETLLLRRHKVTLVLHAMMCAYPHCRLLKMHEHGKFWRKKHKHNYVVYCANLRIQLEHLEDALLCTAQQARMTCIMGFSRVRL